MWLLCFVLSRLYHLDLADSHCVFLIYILLASLALGHNKLWKILGSNSIINETTSGDTFLLKVRRHLGCTQQISLLMMVRRKCFNYNEIFLFPFTARNILVKLSQRQNKPPIFDRYHSPHVQPLLCQRPSFIKADTFEFAADVDPWRTDAEDALLLEARLCVHSADCHGRRQGRRHDNGDDV